MSKVRQRDPNDKVRTKGKKHTKIRKKQANVSRQMQAAVVQKIKQRKDHEASNEAVTTTTEQAVMDIVAGSVRLTGKASGVVYHKVMGQQTQNPGADSRDGPIPSPELEPEPTSSPQANAGQSMQYTEQVRKQAVQEYADSHYRSRIPAVSVSAPTSESMRTGVQPKQKQQINLDPPNLPKSREYPKPDSDNGVVEMGRKSEIQTYIKNRLRKRIFSRHYLHLQTLLFAKDWYTRPAGYHSQNQADFGWDSEKFTQNEGNGFLNSNSDFR